MEIEINYKQFFKTLRNLILASAILLSLGISLTIINPKGISAMMTMLGGVLLGVFTAILIIAEFFVTVKDVEEESKRV